MTEQKSEDRGKVLCAMIASATAIFMVNLDITIVNIALPTFCRLFTIDPTDASMVVLSYLLALTGFLLVAGKLSDKFGTERVFLLGYCVFSVGSLLCAIAHSFAALVLFRFIQGLGSSLLFATSAVIVVRYVAPEKRGRAYGLNGLFAGIAFALGSPVGGFLIHSLGWQWIFLVNIPVSIVGISLSLHGLVWPRGERNESGFDYIGALLSFLTLTAMLFALNRGEDMGWHSPAILCSIVLAAFFFTLFIMWEKKFPCPILELSLFRDHRLNATLAANFIYLMLLCGITFVLPFYFEELKGFHPQKAGLYMMIFPILSMFISPLSGYLSDRIGPRTVCMTGMGLFLAACSVFLCFNAATPDHVIIVSELVLGLGMALFMTAVLTMVMTYAEPGNLGMLSAIKAVIPQIGASIGVAVFAFLYNMPSHTVPGTEILKNPALFLAGYRNAMIFGVILALAGIVTSALSGPKKKSTSTG